MLRVPPPSIIRWAVLCGYALLVSLGHGGWHLVTGDQCGAHGHSHAGHGQFCSHGHWHAQPDSDEKPAPEHPTHHDSDHCAICAVFAAPQTLVVTVELAVAEFAQEQVDPPVTILATSNQTHLPEPRGPPLT